MRRDADNMLFKIDLSVGDLSPFYLVCNLLQQLDIANERALSLAVEAVWPLNKISDWVYLDDSFGDPGAIRAEQLNALLSAELKRLNIDKIELHVCLAHSILTNDNHCSLIFLAESLRAFDLIFYLEPENIALLQQQIKTLGVINNVTIRYEGQHYQIQSDKPLFVDLKNVISYAWTTIKCGAYQIGCRALENLLLQNNEALKREEIIFHLTIIRFLSHQHDKVVQDTSSEGLITLGTERIQHLYFIKAFSATLSRKLEDAAVWFAKAGISVSMEMTDEDSVYKLNLFALYLLIKGESQTAFDLEKKLYNYLHAHLPNSAIVKHVALMNIARLHKKFKNYDDAEYFYDKAYGVLNPHQFTLFDHMNYGMDRAILCEARGSNQEASLWWKKVACYWFACPNPYALAVRTRLVLCQERVVDTTKPLDREKVNRFLLDKLNHLSGSPELSNSDRYDQSEEGFCSHPPKALSHFKPTLSERALRDLAFDRLYEV